MCHFFSFCTDEYGKKYFFNWKQRQEMKFEGADSHDHIMSVYGLKTANCFEYNPLLKSFATDKVGTPVDNRVQAEAWVKKLDFKTIIEPLIIKEIINPLTGKSKKPTQDDIDLLKKRASVWASVWYTARYSVRYSVWNSVGYSVGDSVGDSVWNSARDTVRDTVGYSVWAYISSFVDVKYNYDFTPAVTLWERGFVPSFDGTTWRLHSGKDAKIVYKIKDE